MSRRRVGDYRIQYHVEVDRLVIVMIKVGDRPDVHR